LQAQSPLSAEADFATANGNSSGKSGPYLEGA
jgi:hypothetical protein